MDSSNEHGRMDQRRPAPTQSGGTVEPANRAAVAKSLQQAATETPRERFELRDPFAEVTYRANTFGEMAAKADKLGSTRFIAVDADGRRTPVEKIRGKWERAAIPRPPESEQSQANRDEPAKEKAKVVPITPAIKQPDLHQAEKIAKLDANAERAALAARLEAALLERYIIKRAPVTVGDVTLGKTEYRFRGDSTRVAFTESTFRLATDTNSPSVARSMVDVAQGRNWRALRVSGNEDFKRMVWLEASVRGVKAVGYEPNAGDLDVLRREREARQVNRIEPAKVETPEETTKAKGSARGSGGRKAVLAAIEAVLVAKGLPENKRTAVMEAAAEKLAQRVRDGQPVKVKVYDKAAPSLRTVVTPQRDVQRAHERTGPTL